MIQQPQSPKIRVKNLRERCKYAITSPELWIGFIFGIILALIGLTPLWIELAKN